MLTIYKYRVWCETDSKWEYIWLPEGETPTKCPENGNHTIDTDKTTVVDKISEDLVTVKEENVPTGGHYQAQAFEIDVPLGSGKTELDISYPHPISLLAATWTNKSIIEGDEIEFTVAPDTTVGSLASGVASGVDVLPVSQDVINNIEIGYCLKLYSASGVQNCSRVLEVDSQNKTVTVEKATVQAFEATWPTYVRQTVHLVRNSPLAGEGLVQLGEAKIGGSYVPADTVLRAIYNNKTTTAKKLVFFIEYLY